MHTSLVAVAVQSPLYAFRFTRIRQKLSIREVELQGYMNPISRHTIPGDQRLKFDMISNIYLCDSLLRTLYMEVSHMTSV